jgi:site-specific DNA-methyltransferase (adenine-specific)
MITWTNETRKLSQLKPWPRNPRQITEKQAKRLNESFDQFGQVETIAVGPDNEIYNGHQRLNVLMAKHGANYEIECRVSSRELTEKEREKLTVFLHKGAAGEWDFDTLANEFELDDLLEWGFDKKELDLDLWAGEMADDPGAQMDRAEELREKWGVNSGDLWQLGEHRLICGDCTDRAVVERVMGGERAELAPVDPPYNVGFDYDGKTVDDEKTDEKYERFSRTWFGLCQEVSERQLVTPGCYNLASWLRWFDAYHWGVWTKTNSMTNGRVSRFWCWEPVLFFGEHWGKSRHDDIFDYPIGQQKEVANHPCPKPLEMWVDIIENYSKVGVIIYESFSGSGTTLIACERLGRKCRAVEISPAYCAVAIQRWVDMTGGEPVLLGTQT